MFWLLVLIVLAFLVGIVLLSAKSPLRRMTREEFLQKLATFVEGEVESIEDREEGGKSYKIHFKFKGEEFVYEDLEKQGFKDKVHRAYIKIKTPSKLTLTFTEKKRSTVIRTDIFIASDVSTYNIEENEFLQIPEYLEDLKIYTNDISEANNIFEDKKVSSILKRYKNVDERGYPFLSMGIVNGVVILEFRPIKTGKPSLSALREDITSIDDYLEQLIVIARKLKEKP